jgi:hypothetical protein
MAQAPRPITRDQLAKFLPDHETIRRFENLFNTVENPSPEALILAEFAQLFAGDALAKADQAIGAVARLAEDAELAATAPIVPSAPPDSSYLVLSADNGLANERVLTAGANITLTDSGPGGTLTIAATGGGGGGGAPTNAQYVTLATDGALTAERVLTAGTGITITDGGAGNPVTVACTVTSGAPTTAQYVTLATDGGLSAERVLTAGAGISITDGGANGPVTIAATGGGGGYPEQLGYSR